MCKGWDKDNNRMIFQCKRGRKYDSRNRSINSTRSCITCKPVCDEDKCPFNFTIKWFSEHQQWGMNFGLGCRYHTGHFQKEKDEVRILTSDLPKQKIKNIKDCYSAHVPMGQARELVYCPVIPEGHEY
jgi:hypothetical protein